MTTACLSEELDTSTTEQFDSVHQWTDDIRVDGAKSPYQPALAQVNSLALLAAFTESGTNEIDIWRMDSSNRWARRAALTQRADLGPALTMHGGQATLVYKAAGQNRFLMSRSSDGGYAWTSPVTAGTGINGSTILSAPAIASKDGALYAAYCLRTPSGDTVRIDRLVSGTWSTATSIGTPGARCKNVSLTRLTDNRLHLAFNIESGSTGTWYMKESFSSTGTSWSTVRELAMKSKKPMSVLDCGGKTHLVHGGYSSPSEIWWTYRGTAGWEPDVKVPGQVSDGGTALGCFNDSAFMLHNGGYDDLWWSEYVP